MKFSIFGTAALAAGALASPLVKRVDDQDILQFALTLEHLENAFYKQALAAIPQSDFRAANLSDAYYEDVRQIAYDEQTHVAALTAALTAAGYQPVAACTYNFGTLNLHNFITLSSILEGVGTSAYLGAAPAIVSKAYLTVAGSILSVEALHTSLQRFAIGRTPMANPFYTPITPNSAYSLALPFIVSCPSTNYKLPFMQYPTLNVTNPQFIAQTGATVQLTSAANVPAGSFVSFVSGLTTATVAATGSGNSVSAVIPAGINGQSYVYIANANVTMLSATSVVAGPAIIDVAPPTVSLDFASY